MEEERKLYPMKFCSILDEWSWGSEEHLLADLGFKDSLVKEGWLAANSIGELMDTYIDRVVGEDVYNYYGRQFPVAVKLIKVSGKMPLRVHPDDDTAEQRYDFLGKKKLWYVLRCSKDALIGAGFRSDIDASVLVEKCSDNSIDEVMNMIAPYPGQSILINPGTVHFASGDIDLLEISESSPLDFCLCSWGNELSEEEFDPALDFADTLDFIDYKRFKFEAPSGENLADTQQFKVKKIELSKPIVYKSELAESFVLFSCVSGSASVQINVFGQIANYSLSQNETILIPSECTEFSLVPTKEGTALLETIVKRVDNDSYLK